MEMDWGERVSSMRLRLKCEGHVTHVVDVLDLAELCGNGRADEGYGVEELGFLDQGVEKSLLDTDVLVLGVSNTLA
jgi:hypothetical protein